MTRLFISYLGQFPCFITLCLTFYCATASAVITADTLNIRESATQDALDGHIEYYYEKEASADSPVDLGSVTRASFKPLEGITINPGQVPYPVWLRFSLENPLSDAVSRYLVIGFGYIPYVDVYYRDPDGNWQRQVSGKAVDYENRAIPHPHYPFELKVPPGTTDYYVRLSSHAPMVAPSYLMTPDRFSDYSIQIYVFGALYFGFTLAIFLYKLFLFFFLRDRLYLYFILFIGFSCLAQLYLMGLLDGFVSHAPLLKLGGGDIFTQTAVLFALTFIRRLFGSYKSQENFDRFYHWLAIVTFIIWLMAIFRVPNIHFAVVAEVSLFSLVVLYHALKIWREGYTPAGYFFLGWLVFTFGAIITSLIYSAVIPFTILTVFVYPVCSSFQALFLSFSLANRIRILQNEAQNKEILLQRAEAKTEAKSQFFAQMSHEIRTPMNGVLGMAQLLRETPLTQNQRSLTDILFSSGKNLLNIINDILDFSKLEAGKLRIEKTGFNLEQELNEIASNFTLNALEKELEFSIHYPVDLPRELEGDPTRLRQILINLLGNAFKFTTIGSVKCLISGHYRNDDIIELCFSVEDTGIGISEENQKKLFSAFSQAEDSTSRRFGGTGLGLNITKQLVELMNGDIELQSEEGKGSRFIVRLPFGYRNEPKELALERQDHRVAIHLTNPALTRDVQHYLETAGYHVADPVTPDHNISVRITDPSGYQQALAKKDEEKLVMLYFLSDSLPDAIAQDASVHAVLYTGIPSRIVTTLDDVLIKKLPAATGAAESGTTEELFSKVLIAEDNKVNQLLTKKFVRPYTGDLAIAQHGQEVFEEYTKHHSDYDLILMDCEMPEMDGYEAAAKIRRWERSNNIAPVTIVALSGHVGAEHEQKVYTAGMNDILRKPILKEDMDRLLRQIASAVNGAAA